MTPLQFILINLGALIAAAGGIFLKGLSESLTEPVMKITWIGSLLSNPNLWLAGLCYILPMFLWAYLLKSMELTKLQPLGSVVYIYTVGFAYIFLGEQPSLIRLIGIGVVIVGVVMISRS